MASLLNKFGTFGNVVRVNTNAIPLHCGGGPLKEIRLKVKKSMDNSNTIVQGKLFERHHKLWHGSVAVGLNTPLQIRLIHTDVCKVPDFNKYRREDTKVSYAKGNEIDRRIYSYVAVFGASIMATMTAKELVRGAIGSMAPNARTMAEASAEIDISNIPEGKNAVFKWRSKPLFVKHRTAEEIDREAMVDMAELRDPQNDLDRVQKPEWLVLVGICTHLGCVPIANAGDFNGYYCPCHGSHYDGSGRIRKGPAPENLEVPEYRFIDEKTIVVG